MKTIKQIAEEIGVSKQAIRNKIAKQIANQIANETQTIGNKVFVSERGEALIKEAFKGVRQEKKPQTESQTESQSVSNNLDMVKYLQRELKEAKAIIKEKDSQILGMASKFAELAEKNQTPMELPIPVVEEIEKTKNENAVLKTQAESLKEQVVIERQKTWWDKILKR